MKKAISVWVILHVWSGLINENEPFVTPQRDEAFEKLKSTLHEDFGFRAAKKEETMEEYLQAFQDFEYRYRNEYESVTDKDRADNIANEQDWDPADNELLFHTQEIRV
jgi:hypothetical protein